MRTITKITCVLLITQIFSCKIHLRSFEAECYGVKDEGYVTLSIKSNNRLRTDDLAKKQAIYSILFIGTNGESCFGKKALLRNEHEVKQFSEIEREFFSRNGDWSKFCSNYIEKDVDIHTKQNILNVTVAYNQLRLYLENKKIIKKLNHGF
jgi:hypothetical protein